MAPSSAVDLAVRPPTNLNVPQRVPRSVTGVIAWDMVKQQQTFTATTSSAPTEMLYTVTLANNPTASSWAANYDQYCIPQFSLVFEAQVPPGSTSLPVTLYSALDFDNVASLGSVAAYEDAATCREQVLVPGTSVVRSVRPCIKDLVAGSGGSRAAATTQSWVDCAFTDVLHYGIRAVLSQEAALQVKVTLCIWYAFRNQI